MIDISKYLKHNLEQDSKFLFAYDKLCDYIGEDNITYGMLDKLRENPSHNFVYENLQSHNWKDLVDQLSERFGNDIQFDSNNEGTFKDSEKEVVWIKIENYGKNHKDLENSDSFKNLLDFYNYFISQKRLVLGDKMLIGLEPTFPTKINNEQLKNTSGYFLYHITSEDNEDNIKKLGLRCRNGMTNKKYRYFPKRIYLVTRNSIDDAMKMLNLNKETGTIFSISFDGWRNLDIYEDPVSEPGNYFTYTNIPKEFIKCI